MEIVKVDTIDRTITDDKRGKIYTDGFEYIYFSKNNHSYFSINLELAEILGCGNKEIDYTLLDIATQIARFDSSEGNTRKKTIYLTIKYYNQLKQELRSKL